MGNRIAIIVQGTDNTERERLNGLSYGLHINDAIQMDTTRVVEFLKKPIFGNWQPHEIVILSKGLIPVKQQVEITIPQNVSFLFFYYMGHGDADENENVLMRFSCEDDNTKPADDLFVRELDLILKEKNASNYLVIANCCRTIAEMEPINLKLIEFPLEAFDNYKMDAEHFMNIINGMSNQKVIVYTTLKNRKALYGNTGNVFTESFFRSAFHWIGLSYRSEVLFIKEIIDLTNEEMAKHGGQEAEIENYQDSEDFNIPICILPLTKKE